MGILFEILAEIIVELFFESAIEGAKCSKLPKWLRIVLLLIVIIAFTAVIAFMIFLGVLALKNNVIAGIVVILASVLIALALILKTFKEIEKYK